VLGLCALLAGCGLMARKEREEQQAAAKAAMAQKMEACDQQFPADAKRYVERYRCRAEAAKVIRPFTNYPDLFD
jgi:hypothetical protein